MTSPAGPRRLTQQAAEAAGSPTDLVQGTVTAVTAYGITVARAAGTIQGAAHLQSYAPAVGDTVAMVRVMDSWFVLGRPVGPGTATDSATPGRAAGTTLLGGMGLSGGGATMASSTGSLVTVPRYGVTFHHPENHWVMLWAGYNWYSSTANDWLTVTLRDTVTGAIYGFDELLQAGNNFLTNYASKGFMVPPTYGGRGYSVYMTLQRVNGVGTSRIDDVALRRGFLLALDMGDGSVVGTA